MCTNAWMKHRSWDRSKGRDSLEILWNCHIGLNSFQSIFSILNVNKVISPVFSAIQPGGCMGQDREPRLLLFCTAGKHAKGSRGKRSNPTLNSKKGRTSSPLNINFKWHLKINENETSLTTSSSKSMEDFTISRPIQTLMSKNYSSDQLNLQGDRGGGLAPYMRPNYLSGEYGAWGSMREFIYRFYLK